MRRSAMWKEETAVWRDVTADLEHDLGSAPELERARVAPPSAAVHVDRDGAAERSESASAERLAPHAEEMAQRRSAFVVDNAAWIERPSTSAAAGAHNTAQAEARSLEPNGRRDYDDALPRKQFNVNARTSAEWSRVAGEAGRLRFGRGLIAGPSTHRGRHEAQHDRRGPERNGARVHRHQATRAVLCLLACALAAGIATPYAKADGDPASDYLISQSAFLSYDAKIPSPLEQKLLAAVASANRNGYPVKVALIWSRYDLGSLPVLFGKPRNYALFLDAEDARCWWGAGCSAGRFSPKTHLLVVMPNGLGFAQWKHKSAAPAAYRTLAGIKVTRTPAGLATAATTAVERLAAASGVKVSTSGGPGLTAQSGGGTSRVEIIVGVVAAILIGAAALLLIRRRAARSTLR
jgi:hypothetical protein